MRIINFLEAKKHLEDILDQVRNEVDYTIISRKNNENIVLMSLDQFNSLMETIYLLKSPKNAVHLNKSIQQYKAGKAVKKKKHIEQKGGREYGKI